jgi:hypothetical protein
MLGVAIVLVLAGFFLAIAGLQATSRDTGERIHRRAAATLTDIDAVLPGIETQLDELGQSPEGESVQVPGYPIPVALTAEEAQTIRGAQLHDRLLDESGTILYQDGMDVWAKGDPEGTQEIDNVSNAAAVYRSLNLVRDSTYTYFLVLSILLGVLTLVLAGVLLLTIRTGLMRLLVAGVLLLAASMPLLAAAVAVRFAFKTADTDGDLFVEDMFELGADMSWLPIRMYLALSMVGFATVGIATICMWLESRSQPQPLAGGTGGTPAR